MRLSARYWAFLLLWICYCLVYLTRKPLGIIKTELEKIYGYSRFTIGFLDSAFLLPYAVFQIALGNLGDSVNPAKLLALCIFCAGLSTLFLGPCEKLYALFIFLFLNGTFQAFCWPLCIKLVSILFDHSKNKNFILGIFGTSTFAGGTLGTFLSVFLKDRLGWRWTFSIPSLLICASGLVFYLFYRLRLRKLLKSFKLAEISSSKTNNGVVLPNNGSCCPNTDHQQLSPLSQDDYLIESPSIKDTDGCLGKIWSSALLFWKTPLIANMAVSMFSLKMIRYILYMWLPFVLEHKNHMSATRAGNLSALFEIGGVIGSVLLGFMLDKLFYRSQFLGIIYFLFGHIIAVITFILTTTPRIHWTINSSFLFLAGLMNGGVDNLLSSSVPLLVCSCFQTQNPSALIGFVNGFGSLGPILEGPLIGLVLDFSSTHKSTKFQIEHNTATLSNYSMLERAENGSKIYGANVPPLRNAGYHYNDDDIDFRGFFAIIGAFSIVPALSMLIGYVCHHKTINAYCLQRYLSRQNLAYKPKKTSDDKSRPIYETSSTLINGYGKKESMTTAKLEDGEDSKAAITEHDIPPLGGRNATESLDSLSFSGEISKAFNKKNYTAANSFNNNDNNITNNNKTPSNSPVCLPNNNNPTEINTNIEKTSTVNEPLIATSRAL